MKNHKFIAGNLVGIFKYLQKLQALTFKIALFVV